jgi:4-hydroxythreonine-4-phosphate dehydrogenase
MVKRIKSKSSYSEKILGITMGDPGGVGPELALSAFQIENLSSKVVLIGDVNIFEKANKLVKIDLPFNILNDISDFKEQCINVFDISFKGNYKLNGTNASNGRAAFLSVKKGIELALINKINAIVTCPISKYALSLAKIDFPGHTEILAYYTNSDKYRMLFVSSHFKVLLHTIHIPIKSVPIKIKEISLEETVEIGIKFLKEKFRIEEPVIYVAGLNPHAGENGKIGNEENEIIKPVIEKYGKILKGPFPPDTIFFKALNEKPHMIIAMYHDQGLIPLKLIDFYNAVNVTLGIPFVRTSPDHGTAFDISWKGIADRRSFFSAVELADFLIK